MSGAPRVSIVVAVLDEARLSRVPRLRSPRRTTPASSKIRFSTAARRTARFDHLHALAASDPRVRVLHNPGAPQVAALNAGLAAATGDALVQMDAHTFYPPTYVTTGVARLQRGDAEWVSGPPIPRGEGRRLARVARALSFAFWHRRCRQAAAWRTRRSSWTPASRWGWWTSTLRRLGGWDEIWVVNHDAELAARHIAAGGRVVCLPTLAAEYVPRSTLRGLWRQYRGYGYYRVATSGRHPHSMRPSHVLSIVPAVTLLAALLPGRIGRLARAGLLGYAAVALGVSARLERGPELVPVFAAIHFSWGFGFLRGCRDFGVPWTAFASVWRAASAAGDLRHERQPRALLRGRADALGDLLAGDSPATHPLQERAHLIGRDVALLVGQAAGQPVRRR